jgi:hypothetical protein
MLTSRIVFGTVITVLSISLSPFLPPAAAYELGPEQIVQAGGWNLSVPGYSVPSFVNWNDDGLCDLVVGEGGAGYTGKVRVYLNDGTLGLPHFSSSFYAQSLGGDMTVPPVGCLGAYPRLIQRGAADRKGLLVGQADGKVKLFVNTGSNANPAFDGGAFVQVGPPGSKIDINVGGRATPNWLDWNNDATQDLVVGALDGKLRVLLNQGTDIQPDFRTTIIVQANGVDLLVPSLRASPVVTDWDGDGKKDLLLGNTNGQLLFYNNTGTDAAPNFSNYTAMTADGVPIDLPDTLRSRPAICDWTGDGLPDVLIGYGDGLVHLYQSVPEPSALALVLLGLAVGRGRSRN